MTAPFSSSRDEAVPTLLDEAYLMLSRQTARLPTLEHLDALDRMHQTRFYQLLYKLGQVERRYQRLRMYMTQGDWPPARRRKEGP